MGRLQFVIVTGMSGAGKSTAMKMMEDMGFFCIDNLPIPLLDKLVDFTTKGRTDRDWYRFAKRRTSADRRGNA